MPQRLFAGTAEAVNAFIGSTQARRVYHGNTLVWEHQDFPTLDFTSGSLPSTATVPSAGKYQVTYARSGVAYAWAAGSPLPVLVQVAADTPRFSVCPPGVDHTLVGQPMGLLFEPAVQNILPYGRATATGWTSTNVTTGTTTGIDGTSNAARTLTATANSALHYRTTPPASQTAKWVFSAWVKRITGLGKVWLTLKSGVEIDISAALANFYIDGSDNHQYAWARVYVAIPGVGPWYGDINTCDRIGFRIDESGDAIAVDAMQLEIGDYPTSEILNGSATLNTRAADRLLIDANVGGTARRYVLDGDAWAADASAAALLWRIRQERHLGRIMIEPNGGNWDIDLQTPGENRPNMGWHDGAPSPVIYSISQPEGIPIRDQVYGSGYVIEAATFGAPDFTAPALSALSATPTAPTTADLSVTTDSSDGTIYWVVTTQSATPTAVQVKLGKNGLGIGATYASTTAVASSGVKTKSATGLTASTTYYLFVVHQDAAGNYSAVTASGSWATPSSYTPTAYAIASASSQRLRWRRSSGGLSTAGGTTEKKLSFCIVGESGPDSASDEVYLHTTQQNTLVRLNGSDGKFHIRFGTGATQPVQVTSTVAYNTSGLKWAVFGAWDCTAGTSSKVRLYIVTVSGGALSVETVSNTDAYAHSSFSGTNLGGDAYLFMGSTNGAASYANGKLGMLWWLADFIDWSNSAFRDVLVEKSAADVLQAKDINTGSAANAAVNSLSPEIWLPMNKNEQLGNPYNRGSLGTTNVTTFADNTPTFGNWA